MPQTLLRRAMLDEADMRSEAACGVLKLAKAPAETPARRADAL
jgi:hypothetical protein